MQAHAKASGVEYTIIRPPQLTDGEAGASGTIVLAQTNSHFMGGNGTSRADVARVMIAALLNKNAKNATIEMGANNKGESTKDEEYDALFNDIKSDFQECSLNNLRS